MISIEMFAKAIEKKIGVSSDESLRLAEYFMNFFGFDGYCYDHMFIPEERSILYLFQEYNLVKTKHFETRLFNSKLWRYSVWYLRTDEIKAILKYESEEDERNDIYLSLSDDVWKRSENN